MAISFRCSCGTHLSVANSLAGKRAVCPACNTVTDVPREGNVAVIQEHVQTTPPLLAELSRQESDLGLAGLQQGVRSGGKIIPVAGALWGGAALLAGAVVVVFLLISNAEDPEPQRAQNADPLPQKGKADDRRQVERNIKPPAMLQARMSVPLQDTVGDVAVGGEGRFLVLHLPKSHKLALFDVNEAKVVHEFPVAADNVKFAAGLDKLVILLGGDAIERWDLHTRKREAVAAPAPGVRVVKCACMGSASQGPVLVQWADNDWDEVGLAAVEFLDLQTLQPRTLQLETPKGASLAFRYRDHVHFRAAADGSVFSAWSTGYTPEDAYAFVLADNKVRVHHQRMFHGHLLPGADGKTLYTYGNQLTPQLTRARDGKGFSIPADGGGYYLQGVTTAVNAGDRLGNKSWRVGGLTAFKVGEDRALRTDESISFTATQVQLRYGNLVLDKRLHFIPRAKLIITIPNGGDELVLHRFDPDKAGD
jgi:hypothetical protein